MTVYTIGHSTRTLDAFIAILRGFDIRQVADVRSVPRSRHNPQFDKAALPGALDAVGIGYRHFAGLGGLRHAIPDSVNTGWRQESFRGYADYMQTPEFVGALDELIGYAKADATAAMCAEAVPWRCHRSLIGDALLARGIEVVDILDADSAQVHQLTPFAHVSGKTVTYPAPAEAT